MTLVPLSTPSGVVVLVNPAMVTVIKPAPEGRANLTMINGESILLADAPEQVATALTGRVVSS